MSKRFDSMIFDLDGTLWDSVKSVTFAWNRAIEDQPDIQSPLTEGDVRGIMGLNTIEIGDRLFPYLAATRRETVMRLCGEAERNILPEIGGILYPDLEAVLASLKQELPLFIVSNCDSGYIEAFLSYHGLGGYFRDFLCYGDTGKEKALNIRDLIDRYALKAPVYIGDTEKDRLAAEATKTAFIHAAYGFGKVKGKNLFIDQFSDLLQFLCIGENSL